MNTQFRKGVIEMCVLALIERKDMYGYEIVQSIAYYTEINEGTYYHMTEKGKGYLGSLKADWDDFSKMVNEILRGEVVE